MEFRKNITKGSYWFAITTLFLLGMGRCHQLASHDERMREGLVDTAQFCGGDKKSQKKHWRRNGWGDGWKGSGKPTLKEEILGWKQHKDREVSGRLAFHLLMALRDRGKGDFHGNGMGNGMENGRGNGRGNGHAFAELWADSLRLAHQLRKRVRDDNPIGSRPLAWNQLDSAQWDKIPGIGPTTARKIIRYRDKLGGFVNPQQILEIPKFDTLLAQLLAQNFTMHPNEIRKINSPPDWKVLYKHPYVGPTHAKLLHPFFSIHPNLKRKEWDAMQGLTQEFKDKIAPYLLFVD